MNSGDGEAVMLFAQIQIQLGQLTPAIGAWEQWSKAHPNDAGALAILGTLEQSRGDLGKAEAYFTKSLQIQPEQPVAANNLAYLLLERGGNVDQALTLAAAARKGMPNSPNAVSYTHLDLPQVQPGPLELNHNPRNGKPYFNKSVFGLQPLGQVGNTAPDVYKRQH